MFSPDIVVWGNCETFSRSASSVTSGVPSSVPSVAPSSDTAVSLEGTACFAGLLIALVDDFGF